MAGKTSGMQKQINSDSIQETSFVESADPDGTSAIK
jgi:hypothetical protein